MIGFRQSDERLNSLARKLLRVPLPLPNLAQDEYTGENRCWPCTAMNLVVLAILCVVFSSTTIVASIAIAVFGALVIWFRGYLVPYTPQVGSHLVALFPWKPFHTGQKSNTLADTSATDGEVILESLVDEGIVHLDGESLSLDSEFERRWNREMEAIRSVTDEELAAMVLQVASSPTEVDIVNKQNRVYIILSNGSGDPGSEFWIRRPIAIGETAAARVLADYEIDSDHRVVAAHMLGLFLTTCPACEEEVNEQPAGGCCGPPQTGASGEPLQALVCTNCRVQLHIFN